ncbi:MAG: hypothetical protein OXE99_13245 [Cellvibrionales bacterium]|nr:hypothetical protein [Cellvibrionales bacterium]
MFQLQTDLGVYDIDQRLERFSQQVGAFDPKGMFANKQAKVIGIKYPKFNYPDHW